MKSIRLLSASKYIKGFNCLADCGTDHAKLPIYCVKNNLVKKAYASDNKPGPLENAISSIKKANLEGLVIPILADGLSYLKEEIGIVSILGMGGRLIVSILENAELKAIKRLVLIANSENYQLRSFLEENDWRIDNEELIKERHKFYQLMILSKGTMKLNEVEKEFGPLIIKEKSLIFQEMIEKNLKKIKTAKSRTEDLNTKDLLNKRIDLLEELIS